MDESCRHCGQSIELRGVGTLPTPRWHHVQAGYAYCSGDSGPQAEPEAAECAREDCDGRMHHSAVWDDYTERREPVDHPCPLVVLVASEAARWTCPNCGDAVDTDADGSPVHVGGERECSTGDTTAAFGGAS